VTQNMYRQDEASGSHTTMDPWEVPIDLRPAWTSLLLCSWRLPQISTPQEPSQFKGPTAPGRVTLTYTWRTIRLQRTSPQHPTPKLLRQHETCRALSRFYFVIRAFPQGRGAAMTTGQITHSQNSVFIWGPPYGYSPCQCSRLGEFGGASV
jgi:hypothetical protein